MPIAKSQESRAKSQERTRSWLEESWCSSTSTLDSSDALRSSSDCPIRAASSRSLSFYTSASTLRESLHCTLYTVHCTVLALRRRGASKQSVEQESISKERSNLRRTRIFIRSKLNRKREPPRADG